MSGTSVNMVHLGQ